jgi:HlyD family secretion protein
MGSTGHARFGAPMLLLGALTGCTTQAGHDGAAPLRVEQRPLVVRHLLSGRLVAEQAVELSVPEVGVGPIAIRWLAATGSEVKAGDPVVELDNSGLVSNLEQLDTNLVQALIALDSAQTRTASQVAEAEFEARKKSAAVDKARIAADIPDSLKAARDFEKLQLELAKAELELAEAERTLDAKRRSAEAAVEIEQVNVRKAEQKLEHARSGADSLSLTATRDGIVVIQENRREDRLWQEGDMTFPGWTLARIPELSSLIVSARLFDVDDGSIEPGMPATITLDPFPELELEGEVRSIQPIARQARRSLTRAFEVIVDLQGPDPARMRPGMSAKVVVAERIEWGRGGDPPLLAPREALHFEADGSARARLADGSSQSVTLGPCSATACIVEEGLELGDRLTRLLPFAEGGW